MVEGAIDMQSVPQIAAKLAIMYDGQSHPYLYVLTGVSAMTETDICFSRSTSSPSSVPGPL